MSDFKPERLEIAFCKMDDITATYEGKQVIVKLLTAPVKPGDLCINKKNEVVTVCQSTCIFFSEKVVAMYSPISRRVNLLQTNLENKF